MYSHLNVRSSTNNQKNGASFKSILTLYQNNHNVSNFLSLSTPDNDARDLAEQRLQKSNAGLTHSVTMCKLTGGQLSNHVIDTISSTTVKSCLQNCAKHPECLSMNFRLSNGQCELNDAAASDWNIESGDYNDGLGSDYLHYTTDASC